MHALPISTPSLLLRHFQPDDSLAVMVLNAEMSTARWLPAHVYPTADDAVSSVGYLMACYTSPGNPRRAPYVLGIEHRRTRMLLGHVGFSPLDDDVEVSYAIAESSRGHGFGAEALSQACRWAAETFQLPALLALTATANMASRRTLDLCDFIHESDSLRVFQGTEQWISHYRWRA